MIHLLAFIASVSNTFGRFLGPLMVSYIMLWIAFSIIGYLYKIVPFLWWTHKYSIEEMEEIDEVDVQLVWQPAWSPDLMTEDGKRAIGQ